MSNKSPGENPDPTNQQELLKNINVAGNLIINGGINQAVEQRQKIRRKRIQKIFQILKYPIYGAGAMGIYETIRFLGNGDLQQAAIAGGLTVGVTVIAIAGTLSSDLISKVLGQIQEILKKQVDTLATSIVNDLKSFVVRRLSGFQSQYYQQLIYTCRHYRTQGLQTKGPCTLDLEKVFVPLRVAPESARNISSALIQSRDNPKGVALSDREGGFTIWHFLAASRKSDNYNYRTIVIIGAPGTGKTTLLEHLTLTYAKKNQRHKHEEAPELIPILLYLRKIREIITKSPQLSLIELVEQQESIRKLKPPKNWFKDKLGSNSCLIMLDGLDEVASETQRRAVSIWVKRQIQNYPDARFILTSRPFGYRSAPIEEINTVLEVKPFNLNQMQDFIRNWYLQSEIMNHYLGNENVKVKNIAAQKSEDLINRIKNSSPLAAMALNPLLLTMIAIVHRYCGALPEGRVELYSQICDVFLGRRREAKGIRDYIKVGRKKKAINRKKKAIILQVLALGLMQQKTREFTLDLGYSIIQAELAEFADSNLAAEFLEKIENESALLVEREQNRYEFAHKSFQEYLAAVQIKESNQEHILTANINDDWWEEVIRLYVARSDATNIIRAALANPSIISLRIAFDCLEESKCEPEVREQLLEKLHAGLESSDREIFQLAAEVRLAWRLKHLLRVDENIQIDQSYVTCAEYKLYLDEKLNSPGRFQPGTAKKPVIDISWEDAFGFCAWLSVKAVLQSRNNIDSQEIYYYRLPTTAEVETYQAQEHKKLQCWTVGGSASTKQGIRVVKNQVSPDYEKLVNYLANGEWGKADRETERIMLKFANRESEGEFDAESISQIPCSCLRDVDLLWMHFSRGYFGWGVQKSVVSPTNLNKTSYFWYLNTSGNVKKVFSALIQRHTVCRIETTQSVFAFDTFTVDAQERKIQWERRQARYFAEYLGDRVNLEMIAIPGGTFIMGAPENEKGSGNSERPQHQVTVPSFFMGKYPVTQAQWEAVAALPQVKRGLNPQPSRFKGNNLPVESVSCNDAVEFCARLSNYTRRKYRLPSEAEWEYACRAGTTTPFHFGETINPGLANYGGNHCKTKPVGKFPPNAFGLYDMHGNVWEWCQDTWHKNYKEAPTDGTALIDNDNCYQCLRGGSWDYAPADCRSASRGLYNRAARVNFLNDVGFRVVCGVGRILQ